MGLLDEVKAETAVHQGPRCTVSVILDKLDAADVSELDEALALVVSGDITGAALERALRKRGFSVKGGTLRRHAKGECSCGAD